MKSYLTHDFIACFRRLPRDVRDKARKNYRLWFWIGSHADYEKLIETL